jgi:hypothetical protein
VLFMIEWHAVDAWTTDAERSREIFPTLAYIGGWAAPLFLFLAGVAIPLAAASYARKGVSMREASWALQKRGWQIVLIAHLFRLQSFILNPWARLDSIIKPDILNILGLGLVVAAWCWGRSASTTRKLAWLLIPALLIVVLTPVSRDWWWPTLLHLRFEAYIRPNGGWGVFSMFPWLAYVPVGAALSVWISQPRAPEQEPRFHAWLALAALAAIGADLLYSSTVPVDSPGLSSLSYVVGRTGLMRFALAVAWLVVETSPAKTLGWLWRPIVLFGNTSLFVYWVHVELAYGFFSAAWKRSLTIEQMGPAYLGFTLMLLWMASWWARRSREPWIPEHMRSGL